MCFSLKTQHPYYNFLVQALSEILILSTENQFFVLLLVTLAAPQIIEEIHILWAISWLQTTWKSVTLEIIKNCFRKCGFNVENNCEVVNDQIDVEFWELFDQLSSETDIDKYIDFDMEVVTSLPAIDPLMVDWRQEIKVSQKFWKCVMLLLRKPINPKRS